MKFNCGKFWEQEKERLEDWHEWFAWYPVQVDKNDWRWLEKVQRIGTLILSGYPDTWWYWQYKPKEMK